MIGAYIALGVAFVASLVSFGMLIWQGILLRRHGRALDKTIAELDVAMAELDFQMRLVKGHGHKIHRLFMTRQGRSCYDPRAPK